MGSTLCSHQFHAKGSGHNPWASYQRQKIQMGIGPSGPKAKGSMGQPIRFMDLVGCITHAYHESIKTTTKPVPNRGRSPLLTLSIATPSTRQWYGRNLL